MKVVTTGDVARICEVATHTVTNWIDSGLLPGFRVPGSRDRRVTVDSLEPFLREHGLWGENGLPRTTLSNYIMLVTHRPEVALALAPNCERLLPVETFDCAVSAAFRISRGAPRMAIIDARDVHEFRHIAESIASDWPLVEVVALQKKNAPMIRHVTEHCTDPIDSALLQSHIIRVSGAVSRSS